MKSKDYHDYVIKNGKFIGKFEEMYQNVDDPWHHRDATCISYDIALYLLDRYKICADGGKVLDIGCGKGAFTNRLKRQMPKAKILAVDIAPTAIKKAKKRYGELGIDFQVMDIQKEYKKISEKFNLITMLDIIWYILPNFKKIVNHLRKNLQNDGCLLISQTFYRTGEQKYGNEIVSNPEDMLKLMKYNIVEIVELNRLKDSSSATVVLFKK